jgi:aspartate kinase
MKFGGSSLKNVESMHEICEIVKKNSFSKRVMVQSAVNGVTNMLIESTVKALQSESTIETSIRDIRSKHDPLIREGLKDAGIRKSAASALDDLMSRLKKLLQGVAYTGEATQRTRDHILSLGERMAVHIMAACLKDMGVSAEAVESDRIGMVSYGEWGQGTVDKHKARKQIPKHLHPMIHAGIIPIVTGFFGQTEEGEPITFGRGGTDYSAAVLADSLEAERLEIWKDVDGFLSGSPEMVKSGQLLSNLSYDEAAELSYFGAKILHPRTVEPLLERKIPIVIRNTFNPDAVGTWIGHEKYIRDGIVKSVTFDRNVAMLRVHGADVGYAIGLLSNLVTQLSETGVNIRSVMTSQTCINILIDRDDLQNGYSRLLSLSPDETDAVEAVENICLVAIVGEGLSEAEGLVAKAIRALAQANIQSEMIISGASKVAAYFILPDAHLKKAVHSIHETFFGNAPDGENNSE